MTMDITFRTAEPDDAEQLADIIRTTSGGIVDFLLKGVIPGISPVKILTSLVMGDTTPISHANAVVADSSSHISGLLLAYPASEHSLSDLAENYLPPSRIAFLNRVLAHVVEDSLYVNTLWVGAPFRGSGLADLLMEYAEYWATESGLAALCLHVWADNGRGRAFYQRHGFILRDSIPVERHPLMAHDGGKLLLAKELL